MNSTILVNAIILTAVRVVFAIMWNKRLSHRIVPIDVEDDRIVGIQMQISSTEHMFIFQVDLPCANHSYYLIYLTLH